MRPFPTRFQLCLTLLFASTIWGGPSWAGGDQALALPKCAPPGKEAVELHAYAKSRRPSRLQVLATQLRKDGFTILFIEDGSGGTLPLVSIQASPDIFRAVFGVTLKNLAEPLSARHGYRCRLRVIRSSIPVRYRPLVSDIQSPDPQIY